ncbi:MAG: MotA/TolQ/ExbB proton channel family protein [Acidobacteria bacterium]|nr:MotA/TolQ/ExbB proton channel family protein [Acidobacteriota bacterium]
MLLTPALLQIRIWELINTEKPIPLAVLISLLVFSVLSWGVVFAKWNSLRKARAANSSFLRAFRKATGLDALALAGEQFRDSPLAAVFGFGYEEIERQLKTLGRVKNKTAVERMLHLGASQEASRLEDRMNWLATTATVCPFIGLFGTVWGIIEAFNALSFSGAASLRAVGPGIADALVATAMGLGAAIPAAIFYNHFGHVIRHLGVRMEEFVLEFMNLAERTFEEPMVGQPARLQGRERSAFGEG